MNPRISTAMMYQQSVLMMQSKQARIDHIGRQVATRQRLITAKDDPVAAGTAQQLERTLAALNQYGKNANGVESRLGLQENALDKANAVMNRVKELTIEAKSAARAPEERQIIAREIGQLKENLLELANSADGRGRYLFAGASDAEAPFVKSGDQVEYQGDQTQRQIEIAPDTFVKDAIPGSEVFFKIGPDQQSAFSVLDRLIDALGQPASTPAEQAALNDALEAGLRDVALAGEQFIDARASIGVQLKQITTAAELRAANTLTLDTSLSEIQGLDDLAAISDLNLEKIALQAAQTVFMQMQSMSLFERMR